MTLYFKTLIIKNCCDFIFWDLVRNINVFKQLYSPKKINNFNYLLTNFYADYFIKKCFSMINYLFQNLVYTNSSYKIHVCPV